MEQGRSDGLGNRAGEKQGGGIEQGRSDGLGGQRCGGGSSREQGVGEEQAGDWGIASRGAT